jgi:hypothetical protein
MVSQGAHARTDTHWFMTESTRKPIRRPFAASCDLERTAVGMASRTCRVRLPERSHWLVYALNGGLGEPSIISFK